MLSTLGDPSISYLSSGPINCRANHSEPSLLSCKEKVLLWGNQNDEPLLLLLFLLFLFFFQIPL